MIKWICSGYYSWEGSAVCLWNSLPDKGRESTLCSAVGKSTTGLDYETDMSIVL